MSRDHDVHRRLAGFAGFGILVCAMVAWGTSDLSERLISRIRGPVESSDGGSGSGAVPIDGRAQQVSEVELAPLRMAGATAARNEGAAADTEDHRNDLTRSTRNGE